ncbi:uncharacterized protein LOC143913196 isoform X1 [Arctopsyche grandis]|uniref:uncharacterized protein LOC143913196 isoform X1 n=1 Tax=Arctopsyche grandis TaxID=121162 RepID=UPI00406D94BF
METPSKVGTGKSFSSQSKELILNVYTWCELTLVTNSTTIPAIDLAAAALKVSRSTIRKIIKKKKDNQHLSSPKRTKLSKKNNKDESESEQEEVTSRKRKINQTKTEEKSRVPLFEKLLCEWIVSKGASVTDVEILNHAEEMQLDHKISNTITPSWIKRFLVRKNLTISSDDPTEQSSNSNLPALSQSSTISSPSPTNKQQEFLPPARHNDLLFLACKFLEELDPQYDGLSILKQWGKIIMSLDPDQRLFAKNAIDYVLSEASLRNLNRYSVRINECDPYQHSVSSYYSTSRDISSHPSSAEDARDQHFSEDQQLSIQRNKTMPRVLTASSIVSQSSSIEGSSNMCPVVFASEIGEFSDYMRTMILGINNMLKDQKTLAINLIYETAKNGSLGNLLLNTGVVNTLDIPENFVPVQ